jgi:hypothetical protein
MLKAESLSRRRSLVYQFQTLQLVSINQTTIHNRCIEQIAQKGNNTVFD